MSKHDIDHSCGHSETHQIYGKQSERPSKERWLSSRPCSACKAAAVASGRSAESEKAAKDAEAKGLVALAGSGKQIAWAERIRAAFLNEFDAEAKKDPEWKEEVASAIHALTREASAAWWIDNRDEIDFGWLSAKADELKGV